MRRIGFGTSSSQDDKSSAEFEELAMPLFDSLYNFARWLVRNQNDAEDLVQETYLKALHSFASFQRGNNAGAEKQLHAMEFFEYAYLQMVKKRRR
jgi:Sigma-70 region 2